KKKEISKINHLSFHLRKLERKEQIKSKVCRRKKIIRIRVEIHNTENRKSIEKTDKTKSWFFVKIEKINKPLTRLRKKKKKKTQIADIRNETRDIITIPRD
ncbi:LORF2 protein, partial [Crocuta crocuta]